MFSFLLYFLPCVLIMAFLHYKNKYDYTWKEMLVQLTATAVVVMAVIFADTQIKLYDIKYVSGVVVAKDAVKKYCRSTWEIYEDSWCENHYTKTKTESYTTISDGKVKTKYRSVTYYKPMFSWERKFFVKSNLEEYRIRGVDSQGVVTPPRYEEVAIGDPTVSGKYFKNYPKAASSSLFKYTDDSHVDLVIERPPIHDYYKMSRFINTENVELPKDMTVKEIENILAKLNSSVDNGSNFMVLVTDKDDKFADSVQVKWDGFKINDIIVVLGVNGQGKYNFVKVFSWAVDAMVEVKVKNAFMHKEYDDFKESLEESAKAIKEYYKEASPNKFAYLSPLIELSIFAKVVLVLILIVVTPIVSVYFIKKDIL